MIFYRYTINYYPHPVLELSKYHLVKETKCGYWIGFKDGDRVYCERWVSNNGKARYAYPSKEEAYINFIKRTERRIKILNSQISNCRLILSKEAKNKH